MTFCRFSENDGRVESESAINGGESYLRIKLCAASSKRTSATDVVTEDRRKGVMFALKSAIK